MGQLCLVLLLSAAQAPRIFTRSDPKIDHLVWVRKLPPYLDKKRVGFLPFQVPDSVSPEPPSFAEILQQLVQAENAARSVTVAGSVAFAADDVDAAARFGRLQGYDLVVLGRVDSLFRRSNGGLVLKITLRLVSTSKGEVLWYGAKKADWIRYFPLEDCLRSLAYAFLDDLLGAVR